MATTLTRNLKLRINSNLTADSKYNLERLDLLGSTFLVDSNNTLKIRSSTDVLIEPNSADVGGSGTGGTVSIGTASHNIDSLAIYATNFNLSTNLGLADQGAGGNKNLLVRYKSDLNGSTDTAANRTLSVDLDGSDRSMILGGSLIRLGDLNLNLSGATSLALPVSGTVSTLAGSETLTNKIIDGSSNSITGLTNASIANAAAISYSKLNLASSLVNADVSPSAAIAYSKLSILNSVVDADIATTAAVSRTKLAAGTPAHVVINDGAGLLSSEAQLATSRGGTGVSSSAVFPVSGAVATDSNSLVLTNKSISGATNTISNVGYASLSLTGSIGNSDISSSAAIAYSKLALTGSVTNSDISVSAGIAYTKLSLSNSIVNSDISSSAAIAYSKLALTGHIANADISSSAAIAGTKISPDFGNQTVRTLAGIQFEEGGYTTEFRAAQSGQSVNLDFRLPPNAGIAGQVLSTDGSGEMSWATITGTGTVTSVALTADPIFTVSGSPITTAGTLDLALATQAANAVLAGPASGPNAAPTFRSLVAADLEIPGHRSMSADWLTADGTTLTVTHNWTTRKILVEVLDNSNNYSTIDLSSVTRPTDSTIQLTSTVAPSSAWTVLLKEIN